MLVVPPDEVEVIHGAMKGPQAVLETGAGNDYVAIGLDANQISEAMLLRQRETVNRENIAGLNGELMWRDGAIGAALSLGILGFFHRANAAKAMIDRLTHAVPVYTRVASGLATSDRVADIYEDLMIPVVPRAAGVDVGNNFHRSYSLDGNATVEASRKRILHLDGSAQEHAVWEDLINTDSISTIKSLQLAHERGNPVFEIDATNAAVLLPQLTHAWWTVQDIQAEVYSGATVTVPRDPTPLNRWNGVGYIVDHPSSIAFIIASPNWLISWSPGVFCGATKVS